MALTKAKFCVIPWLSFVSLGAFATKPSTALAVRGKHLNFRHEGLRETRCISCAGSPRRVLSMLGSLERWSGVVLPVVPSHPPEIFVGVRYSTYCDRH